MTKLEQMRLGIERIIEIDKDIGTITRAIKTDNGHGGLVATGAATPHKLFCRVSNQSGGVWTGRQWAGGLAAETTPYVLARFDADIERGDTLEWRGSRYEVGVVTRPMGACTQSPLTEVK